QDMEVIASLDTKTSSFFSHQNKVFTIDSINEFSERMNILPCLVLGRLHKENLVPYGQMDKEFSVSYVFD
ncbi:MAG: hypothetical protein PT941_02420, partial [Bacillales bacterium]|nr:hypothetical protein [Bacillales bacterium]